MIGLFIQNNICRQALLDILTDLPAEEYTPNRVYDALLITAEKDDLPDNIPIITLGISHPRQNMHIPTPIRPEDLIHRIRFS